VSPIRNEYRIGRPKFVAHEGSVMLRGTGVQINWDEVDAEDTGIKVLHAGTLLHIDPSTQLAEPRDHPSKPANAILVSDVDDTLGQNKDFHGVYIGGHFYENLMPETPDSDDKTALGTRFAFIVYEDSRLD